MKVGIEASGGLATVRLPSGECIPLVMAIDVKLRPGGDFRAWIEVGFDKAAVIAEADFHAVVFPDGKKYRLVEYGGPSDLDRLATAARWMIDTLQGESGTGDSAWSPYPQYREACEIVAKLEGQPPAPPSKFSTTKTLSLDPDDFETISTEIQLRMASGEVASTLPEGDSCLWGSILAESIRDLNEYRKLADEELDKRKTP